MRDTVEEGPNVKINNPVLAPTALTCHSQRVQGRAPRPVAVTVPVEDRLELVLQQHRRCGLGDPVRHIRHPEHPDPGPMIFGISTARTGPGK